MCWAVHYEGILEETGEVFDTTHEDNTIFSFEIGKGSVIKAWDVALRTMKVKICSFLGNFVIFDASSYMVSLLLVSLGW